MHLKSWLLKITKQNKMAKGKVNKSAVTGRFVKASKIKSSPKTTFTETTKKGKKK